MTHNQYNTTLWHWILKINLGGAIMDEYDIFRRNSAKRIFDIEYSTKSMHKYKSTCRGYISGAIVHMFQRLLYIYCRGYCTYVAEAIVHMLPGLLY